jgi:hypothetical protein
LAPLLLTLATLLPAGPASAEPALRDLARDETRGGHTLSRHVGRTEDQLRARLAREPGIAAASSFSDRATAERVVGAALAASRGQLDAWMRRRGARPNLVLEYRGRDVVGRSLRRGQRLPVVCYDSVVVLKWDAGVRDFYVLTSYPQAPR